MRVESSAALVMIFAASSLQAAVGDRLPPERAPSTMTSTEIKAFNQGLEPAHPYYISCRKTEVIGSLVKKLRVCRTKEQWQASADIGNANAREMVEAMAKAPVSGN